MYIFQVAEHLPSQKLDALHGVGQELKEARAVYLTLETSHSTLETRLAQAALEHTRLDQVRPTAPSI